MRPSTIAYLLPHTELAGGERVIVDLCARLDRRRFRPVVILPKAGGLALHFQQASVPVRTVLFRRDLVAGFPPSWRWSAYRGILNVLREEQARLLHLNDSYLSLLGGMAGQALGIPVGLTAHGPWDGHFLLQHLLHRFFVTRVWAPSVEVEAALTGRGILPAERVRRVPFGVDLQRFERRSGVQRRQELGIPADGVVLIRVARFDQAKDYPTFLLAAERLVERFTNVFFLVLGDKRLDIPSEPLANRQAFVEFLDRHPAVKERMRWVGHQDNVADYLNAADILVSSSISESFPINVLEAMAAGLPVVSTRVGSLRSIVDDGGNGRLVAPRDPGALCEALAELVSDESKRREMGRRSRERAESFFDVRRFVEDMQSDYDVMLNTRS